MIDDFFLLKFLKLAPLNNEFNIAKLWLKKKHQQSLFEFDETKDDFTICDIQPLQCPCIHRLHNCLRLHIDFALTFPNCSTLN